MKNLALMRLLEMIERDLEASQVRVELASHPSTDENLLSCDLSDGWCLIATFEKAPTDRESALEKLRAYATSFGDAVEAPSIRPPGQETAMMRLDEALAALAGQSHARAALVVDEQSPVIWGASLPREQLDELEDYLETGRAIGLLASKGHDLWAVLGLNDVSLQELLSSYSTRDQADLRAVVERLRRRYAEPEPYPWHTDLLIARALTETMRHTKGEHTPPRHVLREASFGCLVRTFASIYRVVLVFDQSFSELGAEGALVRSLPRIERMVLSLPPIEPPPRGAKVVKLPLR